MDFIFAEIKRVLPVLLTLEGVCVMVSLLLGLLDYTVFIGAGYGILFSLLYFFLLGSVVKNALERPPEQAKRFLRMNYMGRYLLLGAILTVAFLSKHVNPWCVCAAFLAPKLTYTLIGLRDYLRFKWKLPERGGDSNKTEKEE